MAAAPSRFPDPRPRLIRIAQSLTRDMDRLTFAPPVHTVYNPLRYAARPYRAYLEVMARARPEALLLGMNPGPWGMAQTGVPFGDPPLVREWMGIDEAVKRPAREHPRRPVQGFASPRREGSGRRLWSWARDRFGTPARFRRTFFITNYCPLCFLEEGGRNRTPDHLPAGEREALIAACDTALRQAVRALAPRQIIGIGRFAEQRARLALPDLDLPIGTILHPSPANPAANRDWVGTVERQLQEQGIRLPER